MNKFFFVSLTIFSLSYGQSNNNVENNGTQILNASSSSRSYGKSSATFMNPVVKAEGSVYLFENWNNTAVIHTRDQQRFSLKNINLNIEKNLFESKISEDSIFGFSFNNTDRFVLNNRVFKNFYFDNVNRVFEVIYESGKISLLKGYKIQVVKGSPNPMLNRYADKNVQKQFYFIKQGDNIKRIKLKKSNLLELLSAEQANAAESYAREHNLSFKNDDDVNRILTHGFSN